jgi:hypothetical protein
MFVLGTAGFLLSLSLGTDPSSRAKSVLQGIGIPNYVYRHRHNTRTYNLPTAYRREVGTDPFPQRFLRFTDLLVVPSHNNYEKL